MAYFLYNPELSKSMGEHARRFIESKALGPEEVYSTILKA
jgi:hypothetical protein